MTDLRRVLLINPTITARRSARFPLAVLSLAEALDARYASIVLDGNIDRDFAQSAVRLITKSVPGAVAAKPGDVVILWGTGFGTPHFQRQPLGNK